ncbi:MAG: hypothetical protein VXZ84_05600, partial [Planctomycetota bacterium]|nr:hypothetical protein [Planctomycetota bacterium]
TWLQPARTLLINLQQTPGSEQYQRCAATPARLGFVLPENGLITAVLLRRFKWHVITHRVVKI